MRRFIALVGVTVLAVGLPAAAADARVQQHSDQRPVIFVHGFSGSGLQFQTQAKRLASNGYPAEIIETHDYDSTFTVETAEQIFARLDERITRLFAQTGADKVDLLGHSLGTAMSQNYLAMPARAARVAHYVNLDGRTAVQPPGGVVAAENSIRPAESRYTARRSPPCLRVARPAAAGTWAHDDLSCSCDWPT